MNDFFTILTTIGLAKIANATITETPIGITTMVVGDGNGSYYTPTVDQTSLRKEVWRGNVNAVETDASNPKWIKIEGLIPSTVGGFTVREVGVIDGAGDLIAVGKYPATYKPTLDEGSSKDLILRMILEVSNASAVTLKVDPSVVMASKKYVDDGLNKKANSTELQELQKTVNEHQADLASQSSGKGASLIGINDSGNKFTATNVEGALNELFTSASNGKTAIEDAITGVDETIVIPPTPTFSDLATAISSIETGIKINGTTLGKFNLSEPLSKGDLATFDKETTTKLSNPSVMPANFSRSVAFNKDGTLLAVGTNDATPSLILYSVSGTTFTKVDITAQTPTIAVFDVAFSPDGKLLIAVTANSPYLYVYSVNGTTLTKLANPATMPPSSAYGCSFNKDGSLLAIGHATNPFLTVYSVSGTTLTKIANPATLPTGTSYDVDFNDDGTLLAVAHNTNPYMTVYSVSGATLTKLDNPSPLPPGLCNAVGMGGSENYIAIGGGSGYINLNIYKVTNNVVEFVGKPTRQPTGVTYGTTFSDNGELLALVCNGTPNFVLYSVENDEFNELTGVAPIQTGSNFGNASFAKNDSLMAIGIGSSSSVETLALMSINRTISKAKDTIYRRLVVANEDGSTGNEIETSVIWEVQ